MDIEPILYDGSCQCVCHAGVELKLGPHPPLHICGGGDSIWSQQSLAQHMSNNQMEVNIK